MKLELPTLSSKLFSWNGNKGFSEISTVGAKRIFSRMYDDSLDYAFNVRSERTDCVATFIYIGDVTTGNYPDNEVISHLFETRGGKLQIEIYNT